MLISSSGEDLSRIRGAPTALGSSVPHALGGSWQKSIQFSWSALLDTENHDQRLRWGQTLLLWASQTLCSSAALLPMTWAGWTVRFRARIGPKAGHGAGDGWAILYLAFGQLIPLGRALRVPSHKNKHKLHLSSALAGTRMGRALQFLMGMTCWSCCNMWEQVWPQTFLVSSGDMNKSINVVFNWFNCIHSSFPLLWSSLSLLNRDVSGFLKELFFGKPPVPLKRLSPISWKMPGFAHGV